MCRQAPHLTSRPSQECALLGRRSTPHAVQLWMCHRVSEACPANTTSCTERYRLRKILTWLRKEELYRKPSARRQRIPRAARFRGHSRPGGEPRAALLDFLDRLDGHGKLLRISHFARGAVRLSNRRFSTIERLAPTLIASNALPFRTLPRVTTGTRRGSSGRANWVRLGRSLDDFTAASKHLHAESG